MRAGILYSIYTPLDILPGPFEFYIRVYKDEQVINLFPELYEIARIANVDATSK